MPPFKKVSYLTIDLFYSHKVSKPFLPLYHNFKSSDGYYFFCECGRMKAMKMLVVKGRIECIKQLLPKSGNRLSAKKIH